MRTSFHDFKKSPVVNASRARWTRTLTTLGFVASLGLVLGAPRVTSSQESPALPASPSVGPQAWKEKLDAVVKQIAPTSQENADLVSMAYARLKEITKLTGTPVAEDEQAYQAVTCSLWVEAAMAQLKVIDLRRQQKLENEKRTAALAELASVQDEWIKLERGYSTSLKTNLKAVTADLEDQRKQAQQLREDAEKRFSELNSALIQVKKDARGTIISMSDILFDVGKASLTNDLKTSLAKIAGILTIYKDANVVIEGHTDNQGGEDLNQKLSEKRAGNVRDFLVQPGGVDSTRLSAVGYGFSKPIADNATKEGRQKNRRVDLVISDKKP
jgi:outer membrane protein OmpA-like peptidoglycan-associated protein